MSAPFAAFHVYIYNLSSMISNNPDISRENQILAAARLLGEYFYPNCGSHPPNWVLVPAIRELAYSRRELSPEGLFASFVAEAHGKYRKYLSQYVAALSKTDSPAPGIPDACTVGVFTGGRRFSFTKLCAMVSFLFTRENPIRKEKLNDLLFFSDFINYSINGQSISGAKYVRERNTP